MAKDVIILGQGPSFNSLDLDDLRLAQLYGALVIAVNGAIDRVPWSDVFFTLDHSEANVHRMRDALPGVKYVHAAPDDYRNRFDHVTYLRRISLIEDSSKPFMERVWKQLELRGLSEDPACIHTGNSAFGALGLAYHMRPRRIVMVGVDGHGTTRCDGTQNGYLEHLPRLFETAWQQLYDAGIETINASPGTAVCCFPVDYPGLVLRKIMEER